jgi:hypothetical protein
MACARPAKAGFFPLDEQLALRPGSLTPTSQEQVVHLAAWMPFGRAVQMLGRLTGVQISEATARRQTYQVGEAVLAVQQLPIERWAKASAVPDKMVVSPDGAMVPLVGGQWAEVKTVVVGEVVTEGATQETRSRHLSYFSRMVDAQTFTEQASGELVRRGVDQAKQVCAVMDGAEWIDGFLDGQRPDALRVLDFAHAAEYVNAIGQLAQTAGSVLPADWLKQQLHALKHQGPTAVLAVVQFLRDTHPEVEELSKKVAYLEKREARMQYPQYQADHWPMGSGIVESGNKVVMQVRLKGPGMHWAPAHVNPLLALRTSACNDRWDEAMASADTHRRTLRLKSRRTHQLQRSERLLRSLQLRILLLRSRTAPSPSPSPTPPTPARSTRPSANHPWRKTLLAKK